MVGMSAPFAQRFRRTNCPPAIQQELGFQLYSDSSPAPIAQTPDLRTIVAQSRRARSPKVFRNPRRRKSCLYESARRKYLQDPFGRKTRLHLRRSPASRSEERRVGK